MKAKLALGIFSAMILTSCSHHSTMRGSVAMKTGADTAHVCLGHGEVRTGDKVIAYKNVCKNTPADVTLRKHLKTVCTKEKIGEGVVSSIIDDHYSEVKFDQGVEFQEGTIVEKAK